MTSSTKEPMMGLGRVQQHFLQAMSRHGRWFPGCGWQWDRRSRTVLICEALLARGLLQRPPGQDDAFELSATGKSVVRELKKRVQRVSNAAG